MHRLTFVTTNPGKLREARAALAGVAEVEGADVPATEIQADDLPTVARAKAESLRGRVPEPYFVDDGGLFVRALSGFPGVYSAYALRTIRVDGVLRLMEGERDRRAAFACAVALASDGGVRVFEGRCEGSLAESASAGGHGFGFDPIFRPEGDPRTFAEIPVEEKNAVSHRGRALAALRRRLL